MKKRIGASLIGVAYTFSRAINNYNGDNGDGTLFRAYPVSYALNKQLAGFDRTHTFQLYHVYQLPFGKGHKLAQPRSRSLTSSAASRSAARSAGSAACRSPSAPAVP